MPRKQIKLPRHVRNYLRKEICDYEANIEYLKQLEDDILYSSGSNDGQPRGNKTGDSTAAKAEKLITSRAILIVTDKISKIKRALDKLSEDEYKDVEKIFFQRHSQAYAEIHDNISKDMYYDIMNKMIYLTAIEYGEIWREPKND